MLWSVYHRVSHVRQGESHEALDMLHHAAAFHPPRGIVAHVDLCLCPQRSVRLLHLDLLSVCAQTP